MTQHELIPHLFRLEFSKITAVISRRLGIAFMEVAEDIASETFLLALETWTYKGIPQNPSAWLYTVAKNKARNYVVREKTFQDKVIPEMDLNSVAEFEIDLTEKNITDSQLQMLFAICHPVIPREAQIGLALRTLCGFGVDEIATAFLTSKEVINKRLFRAREKLRQERVRIEFPSGSEIDSRLEAVLTTLYLLFSEGYYSESHDDVLRKDLCLDAMRLANMLIENEQTNIPTVNALLSLMCFHASRFDARRNSAGDLILYDDQDESRWNHELISQGAWFLKQASHGDQVSKYHMEASIAYWHTFKTNSHEKWSSVLKLYDQLLELEYSPVVALNRVYALSKVKGNQLAIDELESLQLTDNQYFYALLGDLYREVDEFKSRENFMKALALARTHFDKQAISRKVTLSHQN
jgi:RNA polymerase sigma factor (sigma-70 family)